MRKDFNGGYVEYHVPNITDGLRLVGRIKKALPLDPTQEDILAETIENAEILIDKVVIDGKESDYKSLLEHRDASEVIIRIADFFVGELFMGESEKKQSAT